MFLSLFQLIAGKYANLQMCRCANSFKPDSCLVIKASSIRNNLQIFQAEQFFNDQSLFNSKKFAHLHIGPFAHLLLPVHIFVIQ